MKKILVVTHCLLNTSSKVESYNIEDDNSKLHDFYNKEDDVIIVRIEKTVDRDQIFNNTKYCIN